MRRLRLNSRTRNRPHPTSIELTLRSSTGLDHHLLAPVQGGQGTDQLKANTWTVTPRGFLVLFHPLGQELGDLESIGHDLREATSMEKRYFTSDLAILS
jgi:hypothetical protein